MAEHLRAVAGRRELATALAERQLLLHYQPVLELRSGRVRGAEALLRWEHPEHGLLTAATFLPAVDSAPMMRQVTGFALTEACRQAAEEAPPAWTVSVNITAADAGRDALVDEVSAALEAADLAPERLVLEVTETGLLSNYADSARVLGRLRECGVTVALDDFGTGYSSLRLLRDLPISELKVDALFVAEVERSATDAAIVANVVRLAEAFAATVVAEGVETVGQASLLQQLGCRYGQGYLWSRPGTMDQVIGLARRPHRHQQVPSPQVVVDRVHALLAEGASLTTIAAALNADGLRTEHGKRWHARSVAELQHRLQREEGGS